jgi:hypothetical protein
MLVAFFVIYTCGRLSSEMPHVVWLTFSGLRMCDVHQAPVTLHEGWLKRMTTMSGSRFIAVQT